MLRGNECGGPVATFFNDHRETWAPIHETDTPTHDNPNPDMHFLSWPAYDEFIYAVSKAVARGAARTWYGRKYFSVNTQDGRFGGYHWISVVIEILPRHGEVHAAPLPVQVAVRSSISNAHMHPSGFICHNFLLPSRASLIKSFAIIGASPSSSGAASTTLIDSYSGPFLSAFSTNTITEAAYILVSFLTVYAAAAVLQHIYQHLLALAAPFFDLQMQVNVHVEYIAFFTSALLGFYS